MNKEDFESLKRGMAQVEGHDAGATTGYVVHHPIDVKAVRARTKLSQNKFASVYHLEASVVKDWEQGRRNPDRAAQTLLQAIEAEPDTLARIIANVHEAIAGLGDLSEERPLKTRRRGSSSPARV